MSLRALIISAAFYDDIADYLEAGAIAELKKQDVIYTLVRVPGVFEVPAMIARAAEKEEYDVFIALGCVVRGETSHYDYVCGESARGLMDLSVHGGLAIGYGILTVENKAQAIVRADPLQKNKGKDAVEAALCLAQNFN